VVAAAAGCCGGRRPAAAEDGGGGGRLLRRMADGGGCSGGLAPGTNMPRDGLEVEAVLAAEAAWELKEVVASMAVVSLDMDVDSPPHLPVETSVDKVSLLSFL